MYSNHSVLRTITTMGLPPGDEFLIQALLRFLDGRASDAWIFVEKNDADVVIVDGDRSCPERPSAGSPLIVESTTDMERHGELILHRPVRSRELLYLLNALSARIAGDRVDGLDPPVQPIRADNPPPAAHVAGAQQTTKSVISRIRSRLGLAS